MTKSLIAAVAGLALAAAPAFAKEASTTLKVKGWHCAGCGAKTENALKKVDGVTVAKADKASNTVTVTFDDEKTNIGALEAAVVAMHYKIEK